MVGIVDISGNPIKSADLQEPQTARVGGLHQQFATHPSRGLTPSRLARILEDAEQGDIRAQHDLFMDMEDKDGHILAEMGKRKRALLTLDWDIEPPRNASAKEKKLASYAREMVQDTPNFEDVILDALDAIGHGFSCQEIEWQRFGPEWLPKSITHRPQGWFQTDRDTRTQIRLRDLSLDGQELLPFGWISHVHKSKSGYLSRAGLHRGLAWPYLFKNYAIGDLAEFLEIYGLPMRLGTYPNGSGDLEKATLLRAVMSIGHDAAGIIPEGMAIDFKEAAKGQSDPFEFMVGWCERTVSKLILGGTLTSQADGKSSTNALGNVHNEVRRDLMVSDAIQLAGTLTRDLVYPLLALNKGGVEDRRRLPRFVFRVEENEDIAMMAEALPKLAAIMKKIPASWAHEQMGIPEAKEGEDVLGAVSVPPPVPPVGADLPTEEPEPEDPPAALAALSAILRNATPDAIDVLAASLSGDWQPVIAPMTDPLQAALDESHANGETADQFLARLPALLQSMDPTALTEQLARAAFATRLLGEAGIELSPLPSRQSEQLAAALGGDAPCGCEGEG
ncbi:MAG: DUF935 domain-containing protein [Sterolibacterium sp.]